MNRWAEYDSLRDLIAAHQTSEVEPRTASQAPSDAGREVPPSPASRPAGSPLRTASPVQECRWCGKSFRTHILSPRPCCSPACAHRFLREGRSKNAKPNTDHACHHCGATHPTRKAMQAHVAEAHPIRSGRPAYTPEPERHVIRHHQWPWGGAA